MSAPERAIERINEKHQPDEPSRSGVIRCRDCEQGWPCTTAMIIMEEEQ